jgi:hypothetical protein
MSDTRRIRSPPGIAVTGGLVYSVVVLSRILSRSVPVSAGDPVAVLAAAGYAAGGLSSWSRSRCTS